MIAISEDLFDVELGFFEDRVGAYAGAGEEHYLIFSQAKTIILNVRAGYRDFGLHVFEHHLQIVRELKFSFFGNLRKFNLSNVNPIIDLYDTNSLLSFGSADSNVLLSNICVESQILPEWCTVLLEYL